MSDHALSETSASRYPILVERLSGDQALVIACESCHAERTIGADEIRNEMNYLCNRCGGWAVYKYEEANKCPNCGKMGFFVRQLDFCCSRVCQLQNEYAQQLAEARSVA